MHDLLAAGLTAGSRARFDRLKLTREYYEVDAPSTPRREPGMGLYRGFGFGKV
jgi:hypothetical protein